MAGREIKEEERIKSNGVVEREERNTEAPVIDVSRGSVSCRTGIDTAI